MILNKTSHACILQSEMHKPYIKFDVHRCSLLCWYAGSCIISMRIFIHKCIYIMWFSYQLIMIYKTNYKVLIIYEEQMNALCLRNLSKRPFKIFDSTISLAWKWMFGSYLNIIYKSSHLDWYSWDQCGL